MAIFASGVEGGVAVTGQTDGITLSIVGDYAILQVSNSSPPAGPDAAAMFTLSGDAVGATVSVTKQYTSSTTATALESLTDPFGSPVSSPLTVASGSNDYVANNIAGLYSVIVTLTGITSGAVLVQGQSSPGSLTSTEVAQLSALEQNNLLLKAQLLAQYALTGIDGLTPLGGTW
jgi:hypothetical protein